MNQGLTSERGESDNRKNAFADHAACAVNDARAGRADLFGPLPDLEDQSPEATRAIATDQDDGEQVLGGHLVVEGVCRAEIRPPKDPIGEGDDAIDETLCGAPIRPEPETVEMTTTASKPTVRPATPVEACDHSGISDILLCQPPVAYSAMLELRLPSPLGRRSNRNGTARPQRTPAPAAQSEGSSVTAGWTGRAMPELPPRGEIARLGIKRPPGAPKRIGSGALVPAKLTWMPKDPFGRGVTEKKGARFRWELMLTAASVTAACGLGVVWLLKSVTA
ncbi:MAG TPA: hypothetical protein VNT79_12730 [Phycisphaerae bacterium]|nr:hypothetical protein [Phycisphaerae bacterium]